MIGKWTTIFSRFVLLLTLLFSGCASSPETQLFLIEPITVEKRQAPGKALSIAVGPVELAGHLERKEILNHHRRYRINSFEYYRWAEPLSENITEVLVENLVQLIPTESVFGYPWDFGYPVDFRIRVKIVRFGLDPGGRVELNALWAIQDNAGNPVELRRSRFSEVQNGDDVDSIVAAMSRAVGQLSRDIVASVLDMAAESSKGDALVPAEPRN